jgi:hypothetical protein
MGEQTITTKVAFGEYSAKDKCHEAIVPLQWFQYYK